MTPINVGIDGSQAAIAVALWGVDEALGRGASLRLFSVIKQTHRSPDDYARDLAHAETSLREAQFAVEASRRLVKIETGIPRGPAGPVLVEASRDAEMICVGSVGIGRYAEPSAKTKGTSRQPAARFCQARMDFSIGGEPNWNRRPVTVSGITRT
jgi:nucleotide-binding universal stress UspA family protein